MVSWKLLPAFALLVGAAATLGSERPVDMAARLRQGAPVQAPTAPAEQKGAPAPNQPPASPAEPPSYPVLAPPPLRFSRSVVVESLDQEPLHTEDVIKLRERLPSGRDRVAADIFHPRGEGRFPAVIVLHGTHGPGRAEKYYLGIADDLARNGYVSIFVRYYDRGRKGRGNRTLWTKTIGDTLTFAAGLPDVDPDRMALLGFSQGAFLALNDAPSDPRIRAVVAYYGGLSPGFVPEAQEDMPPTLLFHGTADRIVPVRRSLETLVALRKAGRPADLVVYTGAGHGFNLNSRQGADAVAAADSWTRTLAFLDFHLKYPAWTPAVLPLADPPSPTSGEAAAATGSAPSGHGLFPQEPLQKVPYLAMDGLPQDRDGKVAILVNPTPEELKKYIVVHPTHHKIHHARRPASAAAKPKPKPKSEGQEIMP